MILSEFMKSWLQAKKPDLQRSTYEAYTIVIEKHINPYFDNLNKPIENIRPIDIKNYITLKRNIHSSVTVRKQLNIIKQAFREAVLLEIIPVSPAEFIKLPKNSDTVSKIRFISIEEANRILQAFENHNLYAAVYITLMYGLRRSEVLGLKWEAVDFKNKTITICHTIVKNLTVEAKDSVKTKSSFRTFPLLNEVSDLLLTLHQSGGYIFCHPDGTPLRPDCFTRSFQRVLKNNGIEKMRFHDLRHATASILFDNGWSVPDVQHWLGHSDIETTMNIYVAYNCTRKLKIGGALEGLFTNHKKRL